MNKPTYRPNGHSLRRYCTPQKQPVPEARPAREKLPKPDTEELPPLPYDETNAVGRLRHRVMHHHRGRTPWATAAGEVVDWINQHLYPIKPCP